MLFSSYVFILAFLPVALAGYRLLVGRERAAVAWLVVASIAYYSWSGVASLWLIFASTLFNFFTGARLAQARANGRPSSAVLWIGIAVNLLSLAYFKYGNFIANNVNSAFDAGVPGVSAVLPLAISFFTFQKIAYLVDVHQGKAMEYDLLEFSLFVFFFPQLIAGPLVHHAELIPQFRNARAFEADAERMAGGLTLFIFGLGKKVILADSVSPVASRVFSLAEGGTTPGFGDAWCGALAYTLQIYFDFSGYSDMAIGLALLFGVRLPRNFASPYRAANIIEFWRRWHITLSRFLRDYLYIPLGGNRRGVARRHLNLMVTMILGGLWHGASWTFVAWGGLHGIYLVANHAWRGAAKAAGWRVEGPFARALGWLLTFGAVVVAWVFFRAESFVGAITMLRGMSNIDPSPSGSLVSGLEVTLIGVLLAVALLLPNTEEIMRRARPTLEAIAEPGSAARHWWAWRPNLPWALAAAAWLTASLFLMNRVREFIYFRF